MRKYAALRAGEADGLEDAVEAEAEAMLLSTTRWATAWIFQVVWTVKNVERAEEEFLWSPRFQAVPFDPAQFSDGQTPPPKAAYLLLDRPMPESAEGLGMETIPRLLGQAMLVWPADRPRGPTRSDGHRGRRLQAVKDMIREAAGDSLEPEPKEGGRSLVGQPEVAPWRPAAAARRSAEQIGTLVGQHRRDAILNRGPS